MTNGAARRLVPALLLAAASVAVPLRAQEPLGRDAEPAAPEEALSASAADRLTADAADRRLERRLAGIFANLEELAGVEVEVGAGVVRLTGSVPGPQAAEQAVAIVRRQEGVIAVDERLTVDQDLRGQLAPVAGKLRTRLGDLVARLPLLLVALAILALTGLVAWAVGRWGPLMRRLTPNRFVADLVRLAVRGVVVLAGVLLALEVLDATALVGAVLGTAGILGLGLGFAFRDLAENAIASVLLSLRQPFAAGDWVVVGDHEGRVARLSSRATILITLDGNHLRIPNAEVFKATILNYTRNPLRRFELRVGIGTGESIMPAQELAARTLLGTPGVVAEPPPSVQVEELGESSVVLVCYGWVDQREADFVKVRSEAVRRVKEGFDEAGVELPEPIYRVELERRRPRERAVAPPPGAVAARGGDISRERHLDERIESERRSEEDLLRPDGARE